MEYEIKKYIKKGFPEEWFDYANELKSAATELWESSNNQQILFLSENKTYLKRFYSRTYFFLMGIAIENLMKGILISENPKHIEDGKISKEISSGHNLTILSEKIKTLNFTESEKRNFIILSNVIPYWGKYPIPKNSKNLKDEIFIDNEIFNDLLEIYEKLELQIFKLNMNGINGPNGIQFPKLFIEHLMNKL